MRARTMSRQISIIVSIPEICLKHCKPIFIHSELLIPGVNQNSSIRTVQLLRSMIHAFVPYSDWMAPKINIRSLLFDRNLHVFPGNLLDLDLDGTSFDGFCDRDGASLKIFVIEML